MIMHALLVRVYQDRGLVQVQVAAKYMTALGRTNLLCDVHVPVSTDTTHRTAVQVKVAADSMYSAELDETVAVFEAELKLKQSWLLAKQAQVRSHT